MGSWNPSRDREPDKKDEQAFKQFLITKYERRNWYKSPTEVAKEEPAPSGVKAEPKIEPPPSSKVSRVAELWCVVASRVAQGFIDSELISRFLRDPTQQFLSLCL